MSEVRYHIDEEGRKIIAERDGTVVGIMPWEIDGKSVTFGRAGSAVCVAPQERRKGIGTAMTNLAREKFPREQGYIIGTTPAISETMRSVLNRPSMETNRDAWFDSIGSGTASELTTPDVQRLLNLAQQDLDRLLGK